MTDYFDIDMRDIRQASWYELPTIIYKNSSGEITKIEMQFPDGRWWRQTRSTGTVGSENYEYFEKPVQITPPSIA